MNPNGWGRKEDDINVGQQKLYYKIVISVDR